MWALFLSFLQDNQKETLKVSRYYALISHKRYPLLNFSLKDVYNKYMYILCISYKKCRLDRLYILKCPTCF